MKIIITLSIVFVPHKYTYTLTGIYALKYYQLAYSTRVYMFVYDAGCINIIKPFVYSSNLFLLNIILNLLTCSRLYGLYIPDIGGP